MERRLTAADEEEQSADALDDDYERVRYHEARRLGLNRTEARRFAKSKATMFDLRRLIETGCAPRKAYEILV